MTEQSVQQLKHAGDVIATGGTIAVLINWLTVASAIITIVVGLLTAGWWVMRYYEKLSGKCFNELPWVKRLFRRK